MKRKINAFTLIELLVGVSIISVLAMASLVWIDPNKKIHDAEDNEKRNEFDKIPMEMKMQDAMNLSTICTVGYLGKFLGDMKTEAECKSDVGTFVVYSKKPLYNSKYLCVDGNGVFEISGDKKNNIEDLNKDYLCLASILQCSDTDDPDACCDNYDLDDDNCEKHGCIFTEPTPDLPPSCD
jgi:prepilin-type N-terminal cleavage/methylation domain-containing protein